MTHVFTVPDMSCDHCRMRIEKALAASGLVSSAKVDLAKKQVSIDSASGRAALAAILSDAGYPPAAP